MTEQAAHDEEPVSYTERGAVAVVTLNRPRYRNAQNSAMTYALDAAFGLHHLAHAHNAEVAGDPLAGLDAHGMKDRAAENPGAGG